MLWLHGIATLIFVVLIPVSLMTSLKSSVPYLVFLSLWALVASHWACFQAVRSEIAIAKDSKKLE